MLSSVFRGLTSSTVKPQENVSRASRGNAAAIEANSLSLGGNLPDDDSQAYLRAFEDLVVVYRCASLNASSVAAAKLRFYKEGSAKNSRSEIRDHGHPLVELFKRPNPNTSGRRWVWHTQLSKELTGEVFTEIVRRPVNQLWTLNSAHMKVNTDPRKGIVSYEYKPGMVGTKFRPEDIWRDVFPSSDPDSIRGLSPLSPAGRNLVGDQLLERAMNSLLKNGMRLGGVLHIEKEATDEQMESVANQLKEMYSGVANWGRTLVAAGGRKFEPIAMEPEKVQAAEMRAWNAGQIMRAYGVWPLVFGDVDTSATRENATTQLLLYHWLTITARAKALEEEITERLIPALKIPGTEGVIAEFDFSDSPIMRQLHAEQALANTALVDRGVLTQNELRTSLGFDPIAWGDSFWAKNNVTEVAMGNGDRPPIQQLAAIASEIERSISGPISIDLRG